MSEQELWNNWLATDEVKDLCGNVEALTKDWETYKVDQLDAAREPRAMYL